MLTFGVWASSEQVFWQSWIDAGICSAPGVYLPPYAGNVETAASWPGIVVKTPAVIENGEVITPAVFVDGWHTNVRVNGVIEASFRAGCPTTGTIWETTHAAEAFGLTQQDADPATGFPAGMRSASGVVYTDPGAFHTPSNVWA